MPRRHVLIGSGPASISAAAAIREVDPSASITLVGVEPEGYYSRPGLAYFLAREVPEAQLHPFTAEDIASLHLDWITARVERIDASGHGVMLTDGRQLPYDRLLVATGSQAIPIDVPGGELDGVIKLDDMADARDLVSRSHKAKTAVVIGGGITSIEIVEGLRAHKVDVHYFIRKERYWSNVLSEEESRIVQNGLSRQGVHIHYFTRLARIVGKDGTVTGVETADGTLIPCDMVAVAVGVLPRKQLAEEAGIACGRGVLVDEYLRSSDPDVFAAGDVAEVCEDATDKRTMEVLWNSAITKGRIAGLNMADEVVHRYDSGNPLNVTRLAGFRITIMGTVGTGEDSDLKGISRGDSETWRQAGDSQVVESTAEGANLRLILGASTIAGAVVMGDQALSFPLQRIIGEHRDVSAVMSRLRAPAAPVAELIGAYWRDTLAAGV